MIHPSLWNATVVVLLLLLASSSAWAFSPAAMLRKNLASVDPKTASMTPMQPLTSSNAIQRRLRATPSTTALFGKLWERMELEEDEEYFWYILNCVAGLEMDLLAQCRENCSDMDDVIKFVVPTEKKTRSHGKNRLVTETKVKFPGYVFANLRLCEKTYEAIQELDFCRSWMGTVNLKGHKKLPPAPVALNELEIEKFGLEDVVEEEEEEEEEEFNAEGDMEIILDSEEAEKRQTAKERAIEEEVTRIYGVLRVGDMVKVTAPGKFFGEDGIVKRLKEGKIFVRFYTYGSVYDHWLQPEDVRKMSEAEALNGLGGPAQPITQRDFEDPQRSPREYDSDARNRVGRNSPGTNRFMRQRRQDNVERKFGSDMDAAESRRNNDNWDWYKSQQQDDKNNKDSYHDDDGRSFRAGNQRDSRWDRAPRDGQVQGLSSRRQQRRNHPQRNREANANVERALDGAGDWSSFVSPASAPNSKSGDSDDFFDSLMNDLSNDMESGGGRSSSSRSNRDDREQQTSAFDDSDFFASLASEISDPEPVAPPAHTKSKPFESDTVVNSNDDDFFASLPDTLDSMGDDSTYDEDVFSAALEQDVQDFLSGDPESFESESDFFDYLEQEDMMPPTPQAATSSVVDHLNDHDDEDTSADTDTAPMPPAPPKRSPPSSAVPASGGSDLSSLTVPTLKQLLKEKGLKVSGKKAELIERLQEC